MREGVPFVTHDKPRTYTCVNHGARERGRGRKTVLAIFARLHPSPFHKWLTCVGSKVPGYCHPEIAGEHRGFTLMGALGSPFPSPPQLQQNQSSRSQSSTYSSEPHPEPGRVAENTIPLWDSGNFTQAGGDGISSTGHYREVEKPDVLVS